MSKSTLINLLKQDHYMENIQHLIDLEVETIPLEELVDTESKLSEVLLALQTALQTDESNAVPLPEEFLAQHTIITGYLILRLGETQLIIAGGRLPKAK